MAYTYEFVESADCIVVTWSGRVSAEGFMEFYQELEVDPKLHPGMLKLYDFRGADVDLSAQDMEEINRRVLEIDEKKGAGQRRVAALATRDVTFGLGRMFQAIGDEIRASIHVTRDAGEAKEWVGLPSDYVLPADR